MTDETAVRYSIRCPEHVNDSRFWGAWYDTREEAQREADEATAAAKDCTWEVRPESDRPVLTAEEAMAIVAVGGVYVFLEADPAPYTDEELFDE